MGLKTNPSQVTAQASPVGDVEKERCLKDKDVGWRKHLRGDPVEDVLKLVQERRHQNPKAGAKCSAANAAGAQGANTKAYGKKVRKGRNGFPRALCSVSGQKRGPPEQKGPTHEKGRLHMPLTGSCRFLKLSPPQFRLLGLRLSFLSSRFKFFVAPFLNFPSLI